MPPDFLIFCSMNIPYYFESPDLSMGNLIGLLNNQVVVDFHLPSNNLSVIYAWCKDSISQVTKTMKIIFGEETYVVYYPRKIQLGFQIK